MAKSLHYIPGRASFPHVHEPAENNFGGPPNFEIKLLVEKGTPAAKELSAAVQSLHTAADFKKRLPEDRICVKDGDGSALDEDAGCLTVTAKNKKRVPVVDQQAQPLSPASGKPYAGCNVIVKLELWAQDNKFGQRINASLLGVQFAGDNEPLGGGSMPSADGFDALPNSEPPF